MIERYLWHRKWTKELNSYLKLSDVSNCLTDVFLKMEFTDIYILTDIKNHITFRALENMLKNQKRFLVVCRKNSDDFNWNQMERRKSLVIADEHYRVQAFRHGVSFFYTF